MARKNAKLVSLLQALKELKTIKDLKINKTTNNKEKNLDQVFGEGDFIAGGFLYKDIRYTFIDAPSTMMGLHRLSCSYKYDIKKLREGLTKNAVLDATNRFSMSRLGIKSTLTDMDNEAVYMLFSIDIISTGNSTALDKDSLSMALDILDPAPDFFLELVGVDSSLEDE